MELFTFVSLGKHDTVCVHFGLVSGLVSLTPKTSATSEPMVTSSKNKPRERRPASRPSLGPPSLGRAAELRLGSPSSVFLRGRERSAPRGSAASAPPSSRRRCALQGKFRSARRSCRAGRVLALGLSDGRRGPPGSGVRGAGGGGQQHASPLSAEPGAREADLRLFAV